MKASKITDREYFGQKIAFRQKYSRSGIFISPAASRNKKEGALSSGALSSHYPAVYFSSNAFKRFTNAAGSAICAPSASKA